MKALSVILLAALLAGCGTTDAILTYSEGAAKQAIEQKRRYNDAQAEVVKNAVCETTLGSAGRLYNDAEWAAAAVFCPRKPSTLPEALRGTVSSPK